MRIVNTERVPLTDDSHTLVTLSTQLHSHEKTRDNLAQEAVDGGKCEDQLLAPLTGKQKVLIVLLAFSNWCALNCFSIITPFFPSEALRKGATQTQVGLIFGGFELVIGLASPICGQFITHVGSKLMFITGIIVCGSTTLAFGFVYKLPSGHIFITSSYVLRFLEALGAAAFITASFTITASEFTGRVSTVFGLLQTFTGLGLMTGPPIGGALYEVGGFYLPLTTMGLILLFSALVSVFLLPQPLDESKEEHKSFLSLLHHPSITISALSVLVVAMTIALLESSLELHLKPFGLSPFYVGLMFVSLFGTYSLLAPISGYLADNTVNPKMLMIGGCVVNFLALNLLGPAPLLPFHRELWLVGVSLALVSLGCSGMFVPPFKDCLDEARFHGFPHNFHTYGLVAGLIQSAFSFGAFLGPTVGGFVSQEVGFPGTASYLSLASVAMLCLLVGFKIRERVTKTRS